MNPIESKQTYQQYVDKQSPNSPILKNCFNAFWVGGLICTVGQIILNICKERGIDVETSGSITSITSSKHNGTDIACKEGNGVISVFDGTVDEVGYDDDKGNYIVIVDKDGWKALYSHLQEAPTLAKGDSVKLKDVIGKVGNTGKSTGPHLHFELTNPDGNVEPPILICGDE